MSALVRIRHMIAEDVLSIARQPSQRVQLGIVRHPSIEEAEALLAEGEAWAVEARGTVVACMGIRETFPGVQGVAWAILSPGLGAAHLALTRHAARRIRDSHLARIEAIALCSDVEPILARMPDLDAQQLIEMALIKESNECAWCRLVGFRPAAVLRKFGQASETNMLFERIRAGSSVSVALHSCRSNADV